MTDHELAWPNAPLCHVSDPEARTLKNGGFFEWRQHGWLGDDDDSRPYIGDFKTCEWCGSISTEDMYRLVTEVEGVSLRLAEMEHGWPHKVYVSGIPNLKAGDKVLHYVYAPLHDLEGVMLHGHEPIEYAPGKFKGATGAFKAPVRFDTTWQALHLYDLEDETFAAVAELMNDRIGVEFFWEATDDTADLKWRIEELEY